MLYMGCLIIVSGHNIKNFWFGNLHFSVEKGVKLLKQFVQGSSIHQLSNGPWQPLERVKGFKTHPFASHNA